MVFFVLLKLLEMNLNWLTEALCLLCSWGNSRNGPGGGGIICCSRSATAKLIVRQRGVATELTNTIPGAITATESLERTMSKHLPPGDSLCTTLSSPQFSQALSMFWSALQSGQAGPVVRQFGLGSDAVNAAATGNLEEFVSALETDTKTTDDAGGQAAAAAVAAAATVQGADDDKTASKKEAADRTVGEKKEDKDDEMALD